MTRKARLRKLILDSTSDLVGQLFYYDRKEDEELSAEDLHEAIREGWITQEEIVERFRREVAKNCPLRTAKET